MSILELTGWAVRQFILSEQLCHALLVYNYLGVAECEMKELFKRKLLLANY